MTNLWQRKLKQFSVQLVQLFDIEILIKILTIMTLRCFDCVSRWRILKVFNQFVCHGRRSIRPGRPRLLSGKFWKFLLNFFLNISFSWGRTSEGGSLPGILQHVTVPILTLDQCRNMKYRASRITPNMVSAICHRHSQHLEILINFLLLSISFSVLSITKSYVLEKETNRIHVN